MGARQDTNAKPSPHKIQKKIASNVATSLKTMLNLDCNKIQKKIASGGSNTHQHTQNGLG